MQKYFPRLDTTIKVNFPCKIPSTFIANFIFKRLLNMHNESLLYRERDRGGFAVLNSLKMKWKNTNHRYEDQFMRFI